MSALLHSYEEIKSRVESVLSKKVLLLYNFSGAFYQVLGEDAIKFAQVCGIALMERKSNSEGEKGYVYAGISIDVMTNQVMKLLTDQFGKSVMLVKEIEEKVMERNEQRTR